MTVENESLGVSVCSLFHQCQLRVDVKIQTRIPSCVLSIEVFFVCLFVFISTFRFEFLELNLLENNKCLPTLGDTVACNSKDCANTSLIYL